jgi:opacity protein-like surface antigen
MNQGAKMNIAWGLLAAVALTVPPAANAQLSSSGAQAHDWEFIIGPSFLLSDSNISFGHGTSASIDSTVGFKIGGYYYLTDHFSIGGTYGYAGAGFNATIASANTPPTGSTLSNGHLYINQFMFDARYSLLEGPIRPYGLAGMGYNYTNSNVANGYSSGCWWDPWWGYYCGTYAHTKSVSGFTYQVGAGVEVNFSRTFALSVGYNETWVDWSHGTPGFGSVDLMFVWRTPGYHY